MNTNASNPMLRITSEAQEVSRSTVRERRSGEVGLDGGACRGMARSSSGALGDGALSGGRGSSGRRTGVGSSSTRRLFFAGGASSHS
jgi:hypothetical protein